ncbi:MAG: hypothetical protein H6624_12355 [Bdellovibrionaceae bacterium]|nr:hypothetical protein [Bdellovibrionales bacterium]MCB9085135.1 hypothetical protein [Pseudobdellovibrionaceae bacterium]
MSSDKKKPEKDSLDQLISDALETHYGRQQDPSFDELKDNSKGTDIGQVLPRPFAWKWVPAAAVAVAILYVGCPTVMDRWNQRQNEMNQAQVFFRQTNWDGPTDFLIEDLPTNEQLNSVPQFDGSM